MSRGGEGGKGCRHKYPEGLRGARCARPLSRATGVRKVIATCDGDDVVADHYIIGRERGNSHASESLGKS